MLAIRIHETGAADKLRADDLPVPSPGAGEVRFRVEAAGLNFIDTYKRSGLYPVPLPFVVGQEAAGVVTARLPGQLPLKMGDPVRLDWQPERVHLFDAGRGARVA